MTDLEKYLKFKKIIKEIDALFECDCLSVDFVMTVSEMESFKQSIKARHLKLETNASKYLLDKYTENEK